MSVIQTMEFLARNNEGALFVSGHDSAIEGALVRSSGGKPVAVYSIAKIINNLCRMGMDEFDAQEYFEYNIRGAYVGKNGPVFLADE